MPQDNPTLALCILSNLKVTNVKILGDLKANKKVKVSGTVVGGIEEESMVNLFIAISKRFDVKKDLEVICQSKTKKIHLPLKVVGHSVVSKYSPKNEDGKYGEPVFVVSDKTVDRRKKLKEGTRKRKLHL